MTDGLGISRSVTTTETVGTPLTVGITQGAAPVTGPILDTLELAHHPERDRRLDLRVDSDHGRIERTGGDRQLVELRVLTDDAGHLHRDA